MQDRPDTRELIQAVGDFLDRELLPAITDPRLRFRALVAANVLKIVGRELAAGDAPRRAEWQRLTALLNEMDAPLPPRDEDLRNAVLELNRRLAARIRAGEMDVGAEFDRALSHALMTVQEKLEIANPRYLHRVLNASPE